MSLWFITGASRGFGAEIVRAALDRGHQVIATARDVSAAHKAFPEGPPGLLAATADVTRPEQLKAAVDAGLAVFGRIMAVDQPSALALSASQARSMYTSRASTSDGVTAVAPGGWFSSSSPSG